MIVSWDWLSQYVDLQMSHEDLVDRLTMSGLNHEGTDEVGGDRAIDLEVTSNRPDCLGHIGVAREIAVLYDLPLAIPEPAPETSTESISDVCDIEIKCPEFCQRYTARLIRGVKVGPSPDWLVKRLEAIGVASVNNVVDATNYVLFECGQPLHAFDFGKINDGKIIVRDAAEGETFTAIDHKEYQLQPGMCMIADSKESVCIGGVMGGADSEVSDATTDILLEAAWFDPLTVRNAARRLNLHSPSSFRFERNVNSHNIDWASRRCCELILEMAGGELLDGFIDVGSPPAELPQVTLRLDQLQRVLGIDIPAEFVPKTLNALGMTVGSSDESSITITVPGWRTKDITREVDLVEEVGRIYGYDKVPDTASVPMAASYRLPADRVMGTVRNVLTASGFDEAMTPSVVPEVWSAAFSPWSANEPMSISQPMLGVLERASQNIGAVDLLRRSVLPSMLEARRINDYRFNTDVELFETAKVYLPGGSKDELPTQPLKLAIISSRDYFSLKGVVEHLVNRLNPAVSVEVGPCDHEVLDVSRSAELKIGGTLFGWIGEVSDAGRKMFGLRSGAAVAELDMDLLEEVAVLVPRHVNQSPFPPVSRDFNFIVDNSVHWADLRETVTSAGGELLESIQYKETFRDEKKDGAGKKRLLLSVVLRSGEATLTGEQADAVCKSIVDACSSKHSASLVA
ncbi:MAG: phenylalanine--tRNA ligase subunit beta [Planctomycetota bacterium]